MKAEQRQDMVWEAALAMAPAFRDKFDFADGNMPGEKNQYQRLADMAFTSAEALVSEYELRSGSRLTLTEARDRFEKSIAEGQK